MASTSNDWGAGDDLWTQAAARSAPPQPTTPALGNPWGDPSLDVSTTPPAAAAKPPAAAPPASPYEPYITEIHKTADPDTRVVARDSLGRKLHTDLAADGHDVKWDGDTLVVDGKPYSVAGAPPTDSSTPGPSTPPASTTPPVTTPPVTTPPAPPELSDTDLEKVAGGKRDKSAPPATPTHDYLKWVLSQEKDPQKAIAYFNQHTGRATGNEAKYYAPGEHHPGSPALIGLPEGYFTQQPDGSWEWTDGPDRENGGAGAGGADAGGENGIDFSGLLEQLSQGGLIKTPTYDPTAIDPSTIPWLQHPETFSPQLVDELKSQQSESQMTAGQLADEDLARFGAAHDLGSSPWLAAGRTKNLYDTRQNIISGERDLDIKAQTQNAQDRLQASGMIVDIDKFNETIKAQATQLGMSAATLRAQVLSTLLTLYERQQEFGGSLQLSYDELQRLLNNDAWNRAKDATGG